MSFKYIVKNLEEEIKGNNRKDVIESYEDLLSKEIEKISKNEIFFNLPLKNILYVISKVDFNEIEESDKIIEIIQNIIKNIIKTHYEEKETILILQNLNIKSISFSYQEIFSLLELNTNCPILVNFCNLYKEQTQLPDKDYEYELQQKEKEIKKLRQQILGGLTYEFPPITEKPEDYESDIFKACKEGKLASVQWLIEKEKEDKNKRVEQNNNILDIYKGYTPIHIASKNGYLSIVQYLIEKQNVDKVIKGNYEYTPLHYACWKGFLPIIEYLLSKGADIEAKDEDEWTPLHFASNYGKTDVVKYLVSQGANKNSKNKDEKTPYDLACSGYGADKSQKDEIRNILK